MSKKLSTTRKDISCHLGLCRTLYVWIYSNKLFYRTVQYDCSSCFSQLSAFVCVTLSLTQCEEALVLETRFMNLEPYCSNHIEV